MKKITQEEFKEILDKHRKWLLNEDGGKRADLRLADLRLANLRCADLSNAILVGINLTGANLTCASLQGANLEHANLTDANLQGANLGRANLTGANLTGASLQGANLTGANLTDANLHCANLDYSCLPLWCGSLTANFDNRQLEQIAYHLVRAGLHSKYASTEAKRELAKLIDFANEFHRADECGKITWKDSLRKGMEKK